jgi:hypothetical protein
MIAVDSFALKTFPSLSIKKNQNVPTVVTERCVCSNERFTSRKWLEVFLFRMLSAVDAPGHLARTQFVPSASVVDGID